MWSGWINPRIINLGRFALGIKASGANRMEGFVGL
jgi:hypothetical protein